MGKRSAFARVERDFYPTPAEAVAPLLPHLAPRTCFVEPCAGDGRLIAHLEAHGHLCTYAFDIDPRCYRVHLGDAMIELAAGHGADCFITNPPWSRDVLHPIIRNLAARKPTWLLFDADWVHTRQSAPFLPLLRKIVSVGRVKWIPDSPHTGKDNAAWYLFDASAAGEPVFIGRQAA